MYIEIYQGNLNKSIHLLVSSSIKDVIRTYFIPGTCICRNSQAMLPTQASFLEPEEWYSTISVYRRPCDFIVPKMNIYVKKHPENVKNGVKWIPLDNRKSWTKNIVNIVVMQLYYKFSQFVHESSCSVSAPLVSSVQQLRTMDAKASLTRLDSNPRPLEWEACVQNLG